MTQLLVPEMAGALEWHEDIFELAKGVPALHPERKGQLNRSPLKNWVEEHGDLPTYINSVATAILRENPGWSISRVIATAVNWAKKTCATGRAFGGKVQVSQAVQTAACNAVRQWEQMKAEASIALDDKILELSVEDFPFSDEWHKAWLRKDYRSKDMEIPDLICMSDELYFGFIESEDDTPVELAWDWEGVNDPVDEIDAFMTVAELSAGAQKAVRTPVINLADDATQIDTDTFEKEILKVGEIYYKDGKKLSFTPEALKLAVANKDAVENVNCQFVDDKGRHSESGKYYAGYVETLSLDDPENPTSLRARMKLTEDARKIVQHNPRYGASVTWHPNYVDDSTRKYYGPTLLSVALTPKPRFPGMSEWEPIKASDELEGVIDLSMEEFVEGGEDMAGEETQTPVELSQEQMDAFMQSEAFTNAVATAVQTATAEKDNQIKELSNQIGEVRDNSYRSVVTAAMNVYRDKGVPPVILDTAEALMLSLDIQDRNEEVVELSYEQDGKTETKKINRVEALTTLLDECSGLVDLSKEKGSGEEEEVELSGEEADAAVSLLVGLTNRDLAQQDAA